MGFSQTIHFCWIRKKNHTCVYKFIPYTNSILTHTNIHIHPVNSLDELQGNSKVSRLMFTARNWVPALHSSPTSLNSISSPKDSLCKHAHIITQLQNSPPLGPRAGPTPTQAKFDTETTCLLNLHTPCELSPLKELKKPLWVETNENCEECSSPSPGLHDTKCTKHKGGRTAVLLGGVPQSPLCSLLTRPWIMHLHSTSSEGTILLTPQSTILVSEQSVQWQALLEVHGSHFLPSHPVDAGEPLQSS